jgi:hypothetical protein
VDSRKYNWNIPSLSTIYTKQTYVEMAHHGGNQKRTPVGYGGQAHQIHGKRGKPTDRLRNIIIHAMASGDIGRVVTIVIRGLVVVNTTTILVIFMWFDLRPITSVIIINTQPIPIGDIGALTWSIRTDTGLERVNFDMMVKHG